MTETSEQPRSRFLSHVAFAIILAIVIARCLMLESIRSVGDFSGGVSNTRGPGAATSIVLDWLSFVPALLVFARRALDPSRSLRFAWANILLGLLAAWSLASVSWADDKFLALISAARIAGGAALFFATTQLVTRWDHLRVIVGVVVGILLVNVVQGVYYQNIDLPDLKQYWMTNRAQIFQAHGWNETDYSAQRFELKVLAGEMLNYSLSANVLGALVVTAALAAMAAAMQRIEDRDDLGWAGVLLLPVFGGAYVLAHTGSKASWAALVLGIGLLAGWRLTRGWLARHRTLAFGFGLCVVALGVAGVVALGLKRGGLPSDSLNFRWRYWIGSWRLFHERPLTGVGWGNFGDAYLRYRLPEATEEIQDPHSFPVRWAVELGAIGLALGLAWLIAWAWSAARRSALTLTLSRDAGQGNQRRMRVATVLLAPLLAFVLSLACTVDFTGDGNYALLETFRRAVHVGLIALAIGVVCIGRRESSDEPFFVDDRPAPWLAAGLFVGVVMTLVQSTIDITLFQPGPWVLVVVMMGTLLGLATEQVPRMSTLIRAGESLEGTDESTHPWHRMVGAFGAGLIMIFAGFVVARVVLAESDADDGDAMLMRHQPVAESKYLAAENASPVSNFDYLLRAATAVGPAGNENPSLSAAIAAAPQHLMSWLTRSRWLSSQESVSSADAQQSIDDFGHAIGLNPNDVDLRIEYADLLERFGHRAEAAAQLEAALAIDDKLDPAEPERLELRSPGKRDGIRKRIVALQSPR